MNMSLMFSFNDIVSIVVAIKSMYHQYLHSIYVQSTDNFLFSVCNKIIQE